MQVLGVELYDVVDVNVDYLLASADWRKQKSSQKFRVEVVADNLCSIDFKQFWTPFKKDDHSVDLLESFGGW